MTRADELKAKRLALMTNINAARQEHKPVTQLHLALQRVTLDLMLEERRGKLSGERA